MHDQLWWFWNDFQLVVDSNVVKHMLTNAQWRKLRGVAKRVGKVDFKDLEIRLEIICKALDDLHLKML